MLTRMLCHLPLLHRIQYKFVMAEEFYYLHISHARCVQGIARSSFPMLSAGLCLRTMRVHRIGRRGASRIAVEVEVRPDKVQTLRKFLHLHD